jgi:amino acid adenylation domain-containing protein
MTDVEEAAPLAVGQRHSPAARDIPTALSSNQCIHELFEEQARRTPYASAIVSEAGTLTYKELDRRADLIAQELRGLGVRPEVLVGVHMEKSPEMVIGIIAILKAGGAYVPMDPQSPVDRLTDAPLRLILSKPHLVPRLASFECPVLLVDRGSYSTADQLIAETARLPIPDNLAYVIYTSGSTGQPKGVAVEHRSLVNSTMARHDWYHVPKAFLLLPAMAFDSAVAGIFGTLTRGGALHLPSPGTEAEVRAICDLIDRYEIDSTLTLPSLYELLLEASGPNSLRSLRTVTVAGERCPSSLVSKSRTILPAVELFNEYGPTEATVWSTVWRAPESDATELSSVPIGRPIAGVRVSVINPAGDLVEDGEAGELCIAGAGLARGYLGKPDLTATSFEADSTGPPGSRRYHTGDLVRRRSDGELEFLGRTDRQLKTRGYRVEPGEVENAITLYPGARQAAVVATAQRPDTTLTAFVIGEPIDPTALREFLLAKLPSYMVPADIRQVESFPVTPNGKVDLRALGELLLIGHGIEGENAPLSATERVAARVWCEVLGLPHVERTRSFFDLGSSLDAVRIAVRLSQMFGAEIPMLWVYEAATVEHLAEWLIGNVDTAEAIAERWFQ